MAPKTGDEFLALGNAFPGAQFSDRLLATQAFEYYTDLFFRVVLLAGLATDGLDQLFGCISHDETPLYISLNVSEVSFKI